MLLTFDVVVWLSIVTLLSAAVSTIIYYYSTKPVLSSIERVTEQSRRIAEGQFLTDVELSGPREVQQLAEQFNHMSARLHESFEQIRTSEVSRRELVENVSHDLRTPLASIRSFVEALQDNVVRDEETFRRYLATIALETSRLSGMIEDLFQLSRLQAGAEKFEPIPYHLEDLIIETLQSHDLQMEEKKLRVTVDIPEHLPNISLVPIQIKRVLGNFLQNAIRYSPVEGKLHIQVEPSEDGDYVEVSLVDEGEGISENETELVFERFYRADKSRSREKGGAGLGLAIAKSLVELHGGTIGVDSQLGAGSRFWFRLLS
jgi:two-component system sensor histidine kinase SaeS